MSNNLRHYATIAEVEDFADVTSIDDVEFQDRICQAEEIIDQYVGPQDKSVPIDFRGIVSSASGTVVVDTNPSSQLHVLDGYFIGAVIEIIGGTGQGQVRYITASSFDNRSVTVADAWDTLPDTTSFYRIYQLAQFPRSQDVYSNPNGRVVYKTIPDALRRAVAAQVEYMISQGDSFFGSDDIDITSENIGNYSYSKGQGQSASVRMVAPRARALLRNLKRSGAELIVDNPTML